jgi:nicotinate dehydrogenase subunit B
MSIDTPERVDGAEPEVFEEGPKTTVQAANVEANTNEIHALDISTEYEILEKTKGGFTRASFLKGGGALVLGLAIPFAGVATASAKEPVAEAASDSPLTPIPTVGPVSSVNPGALSSWLAIAADGTVTGFTGKVDLGQGNQTALSQIIAEDLYVPLESVKLIMGNTDVCPNQGYTAGSTTIASGGPQLRQAAAFAYQTLLQMASTQLNVPVSNLTASNGVISVVGSPSTNVSYGDLVKGQVLTAAIPFKGTPASFTLGVTNLKPISEYTIVGTSPAREDIELKVKAQYEYVHDVRVPGMLHGRVIRPPALGAQLISVGKVPAGVKLVQIENFLAVAHENEWTAINAAANLKTQWSKWAGLPTMGGLQEFIYSTPSTTSLPVSNPIVKTVAAAQANVTAGLAKAAHTVSGTYSTPMETHGSLGPSCAIVDVQASQVLAWAGTQGPNGLVTAISSALGVPADIVHVYSYPASGCYGRNGADPVVIDAALMSQALGTPVRVQWMRHDEHQWDPKGPATVHQMQGGVDSGGNVVAFQHEGWLAGGEYDTSLIGAALAGKSAYTTNAFTGWSSNYFTYTFPNVAVVSNQQNDLGAAQNNGTGVISAWLRSPAQFQITFAHESFIDELAAAALADPIQFRLKYLTDPRFINVLTYLAGMSGWMFRPSPSNVSDSKDQVVTGRGVAMALRDGTYAGNVAEVAVDRHTGKITVNKIYAAQDCGLAVNPRAITLGAEAGIVQGVSRTLMEQVTFTPSAITSVDWETYPVIRFDEAPEVEFQVIDNPGQPSNGSGEPPMTPTAAAIGNAVFDATGVRLRDLPFKPGAVKAALAAAGKSV